MKIQNMKNQEIYKAIKGIMWQRRTDEAAKIIAEKIPDADEIEMTIEYTDFLIFKDGKIVDYNHHRLAKSIYNKILANFKEKK